MFEQIQATMQTFAEGLVNIQATIARVAELQAQTQVELSGLNAAVDKYVEATTAYVAGADARMRLLEANLDALIRIITAEHHNGRGKV